VPKFHPTKKNLYQKKGQTYFTFFFWKIQDIIYLFLEVFIFVEENHRQPGHLKTTWAPLRPPEHIRKIIKVGKWGGWLKARNMNCMEPKKWPRKGKSSEAKPP